MEAQESKTLQSNSLLNYYLTMNINNICRICLEKCGKLTQIFDPVKPAHFSFLIMACASVQVHEGDGLPPYICQRCVSRLNIAFQFKTQCESSDSKLRECFKNYSLSNTSDFSEFIESDKDQGDTNCQSGNGASEAENNQAMVPKEDTNIHVVEIKNVENRCMEKQNNLPNKEENNDLSEYKIQYANSCEKEDITVQFDDINIFNENEETDKDSDQKSRKILKMHQCKTCGKVFKSKSSLVHHVRTHTGERPYVCHLCQKRFVNGGHLHTHMRIHTGEKNHICLACNKAFATAQQLTKHTIAIHTSERPYGCTYCTKRFASSSNLSTHIKIHTGEKNFHCEYCGKTFSTKGQLQQHMLVHTGEKAFLCEFCNKRFSQKAHLIRHLKTHKNPSE